MTATTIFFNGRLISEPGSYSEIDASALEVPALGATGIVAIVGTGVGGRPYDEIESVDDFQRVTSTGAAQKLFRSGDLLDLTFPVMKPSNDPDIPSGAAEIVYVKANPAAKSSYTFDNADGDALIVESKDWGLFTTQINVTIADATGGAAFGKLITVEFEGTEENFDLLGETAKFTLAYDGGADGATRATVDIGATAFEVDFERDDAGQDTGVVQAGAAASLEVLSANAGDTTQTVTVYGLDNANVPVARTASLNGVAAVALTGTWNLVTAVVLSAVTAGDVTVRVAGGGASVVAVTAGQTSKGRTALDIAVEDGAAPGLTVVADGATVRKVVYRGTSQANAAIAEVITLAGAVPVAFTGLWKKVTSVELLNVEAARTLTLKGRMVNAPFASVSTVRKLRDKIAANADFTFTTLVTNPTEYLVSDLDRATATNIKAVTASFKAVLSDIVTEINARSQLVEVSKAANATGAPSNASLTYLAGGHEGDSTPGSEGVPTATNADWQAAIDKLKQIGVNSVLLATSSAAVHAMADAHAALMCGAGRYERDVFAGAAANETKSQLKTRALDLNSRHVRLCGQEVLLFDRDGERTWQPPMFQAAQLAGMQAGSPIGTPLTAKQAQNLGVRQHSSWNPVDDSEEMIKAGIVFMRHYDGKGRRVVRNVTTHLSTSNLAFIEGSVNHAVNYSAFSFRSAMEVAVGKKGFAGTINAAKGVATKILDALMREGIIVAWRNLKISLVLDVLEVEVEMAPVLPVNFVKNTIHLVTVPQTVAA